MKNLKRPFVAIKEWDKMMAKRLQKKFGLSDYQMLCIAFAKGFVIGAIIL